MPIVAIMCYQYLKKKKNLLYQKNYSYSTNLLYMLSILSTNQTENSDIDLILEKIMNRILILHADHEQNVSTSTVRIVGSSTNPFSCIAAGISSLSGTLHGGANEACLHMLETINKIENIPKFIKRAKDKKRSISVNGIWT